MGPADTSVSEGLDDINACMHVNRSVDSPPTPTPALPFNLILLVHTASHQIDRKDARAKPPEPRRPAAHTDLLTTTPAVDFVPPSLTDRTARTFFHTASYIARRASARPSSHLPSPPSLTPTRPACIRQPCRPIFARAEEPNRPTQSTPSPTPRRKLSPTSHLVRPARRRDPSHHLDVARRPCRLPLRAPEAPSRATLGRGQSDIPHRLGLQHQAPSRHRRTRTVISAHRFVPQL